MKNVFVDNHHEALFQSLILLFEKRLGWKLYTQAGLEWYQEGFWNVYPHPSTAEQYLLREVEKDHGITREQFKNIDFDLIICSIPDHVEPFLKLAKEKNTKICMQVGNVWPFDHTFPIKNILASAKIPHLVGFNVIEYHQESDPSFGYIKKDTFPDPKIYSFINCLNTVNIYRSDWDLFLQLEKQIPTFEFKSYGGQTRNGAIAPASVVADKMREARFIFHSKKSGDGFGHVIHNAFQIGTPPIVKKEDYLGKLAEPLMIDGQTCITMDNKPINQLIEEINHFSDPELYFKMSEQAALKFKEIVDYDKEAEQVKQFVGNLI